MSFGTPDSDSGQTFQRLKESLPHLLGAIDEATFWQLEQQLAYEWVEIQGNEILFEEGTTGDSLFILISGRLGVFRNEQGRRQLIGEVGRDETVGEMSVFTGEPRSATVIALRDCVLVKISATAFEQLNVLFPDFTSRVAKLIVERLRKQNIGRKAASKIVSVAVLPISGGFSNHDFTQTITQVLSDFGQTKHLNQDLVNENFPDVADIANTNRSNNETYRTLTQWLNDQEVKVDYLVYEATLNNSEWTRRCIRQADEVILVGKADQKPDLSEVETQLAEMLGKSQLRKRLVLLRDAALRPTPQGTHSWLNGRDVHQHLHISIDQRTDYQRLGRYLTGNSVGLVLAGGAARGIAHVGIFKALREAQVPIDAVGGTSFGALVAAGIAFGMDEHEVFRTAKQLLSSSPSDDYNILPFVSLSKGKKVKRVIEQLASDAQIEDLPIPFFCVSSNMSRSVEYVHRAGSLTKALRASSALPGIFPPVIENGELLVDGCIFNNMPVDVMAEQMNVGKIIAVDLYVDKPGTPLAFNEIPNSWMLLRDKFFGRKKRKFYKVPSLINSMMAANILSSNYKSMQLRSQVDVLFNPHLKGVGLLDWRKFEKIVKLGYEYAQEVIKDELHKLR